MKKVTDRDDRADGIEGMKRGGENIVSRS